MGVSNKEEEEVEDIQRLDKDWTAGSRECDTWFRLDDGGWRIVELARDDDDCGWIGL